MAQPVNAPEQRKEFAPGILSYSAIPYVLPFGVFLVTLAMAPHLAFLGAWEYLLRVVVLSAVLIVFSKGVLDFRVRHVASGVALGVAVFVIWITPDVVFPNYRDSILFQNPITGRVATSIPADMRMDPFVLILRALRAVVLVPIIEELFWRAWLMRWLISPDFQKVPLGAYSTSSMLITALLFASEHGPYWDVGLIAGLLYNWWMIRTRSLGDCIFVHAVTNACLSAYLVLYGKWEYWV